MCWRDCITAAVAKMVEPRLFFVVFLALASSHSLALPSSESWRQCGRLVLSGGYVFSETERGSAYYVEVADTSVMTVKASLSSGDLFCKCKAASEGKGEPFWTNVTVSLGTPVNTRVVEVHLPFIAACAGLRSDRVHLTCIQPQYKSSGHQLLMVPSTTAVKLVSAEGGIVTNPVECETSANGVLNLDVKWNEMEEHRNERRDMAVVLVDVEKLRKWSSCHLHQPGSLQLITNPVDPMQNNSLHFLQNFFIDVDLCVKYVDSAISPQPVVVSLQPTIQPTKPLSKIRPKEIHAHSANDIHAEGRVYDTLIRMAREADAGSSSPPPTIHVSVAENSPLGTVVTTVLVRGEWLGGVISYSMVAVTINSHLLFNISGSTGVIRTMGKSNSGKVTLTTIFILALILSLI